MIRTPLRPLAHILKARATGQNPDAIERENIRLRGEANRDRERARAETRLLLMAGLFLLAFMTVGLRMGAMAAAPVEEPQLAESEAAILAQRADIVDRRGRVLATNLVTHALYAQPPIMVDPVGTAEKLVSIFPDLDRERLARYGAGGVSSAEIIGVAGIEKFSDDWLRDPANEGAPLQLSIDLTLQSVVEEVLAGGMKLMNAKGAAAILMEVETGEVLAMASLPDFDPNDRPHALTEGDASDSPLFNRAVQGVYELGSTFKIFAVAQAMELGLVNPSTMVDSRSPMRYGKHRIRDFHNYGKELSVTDVIVKSSNVGTARIVQMIGAERQKEFLDRLGFLQTTPVEVVEAGTGRPLLPPKWTEISSMTIGYGHGLSASPMHLAAAYATIANGGKRVTPTILHAESHPEGEQVMSEAVARRSLAMMRAVVTRGTASFGEVAGYQVAGKTGTADKAKPTGGYYDDKVMATFASVFPVTDPKYVLVLTLDEPSENSGKGPRRTAGWTAVPVAAEVIRRVAPLMGLRPTEGPDELEGITLVRN